MRLGPRRQAGSNKASAEPIVQKAFTAAPYAARDATPAESRKPAWAHLWSHPHTFVGVQRDSRVSIVVVFDPGHGRGRGLADSHPES